MHSKFKILHVDDEQMILNLSTRILTAAGFEVTALANPQEPDTIDFTPFDMMLCDLIMPGVNGFTVCQTARDKGFTGPIVVLSSKSLTREERSLLSSLDIQLMSKPFGPHNLIQRVRESLTEKS